MLKGLPFLAVLLVSISCVIPLGPAGSGKLVLKLPEARAVEPVNDFSLVAQWRIEGQGPGGASVDVETAAASSTLTVTGLVVGDWQFTVSGKNAANKVLYQQTAALPIAAGPNTLSLTLVAVVDPVEPVVFAGGDGTAADPYQIANFTQLNEVRNHLTSHFVQTADISLAGFEWVPIGTQASPFVGSYTGTSGGVRMGLSNLSINTATSDDVGFFGYLGSGAQLWDISLTGVDIKGNDRVGALVGTQDNGSSVHRSYSTGKVEGVSRAGGLIGKLTGGLVEQSFSTAATVANQSYAGGLVGAVETGTGQSATLSDAFASGTVSATSFAGGLVGSASMSGGTVTFQRCYASGLVTAAVSLGGFIGQSTGSILYDNNYYDLNKSGLATPTSGEYAKTSDEMATPATYAGWDLATTWSFVSGYTPHFSWVPIRPSAFYTAGDGSFASPWQVATPMQLHGMRYVLDASYQQTANINMNVAPFNAGTGWKPIGDQNADKFSGTFDGQGFSISNLFIDYTGIDDHVGLFGYVAVGSAGLSVTDGLIKNVRLSAVNITTGTSISGALIGELGDDNDMASYLRPIVVNCIADGTISGAGLYIGGLIGATSVQHTGHGITIRDSGTSVNITASSSFYHGGLIGSAKVTSLFRCWSTGLVSAVNGGNISGGVGGLVGWMTFTDGTAVQESYSTGSVSGAKTVGGLVGYAYAPSGTFVITDTYATGSAYASGQTAGGLIGSASGVTVTTSWSNGAVSSPSTTGGLIGTATGTTAATGLYDSTTSGQTDTGKGVGVPTATLQNASTLELVYGFGTAWSLADDSYPVFPW